MIRGPVCLALLGLVLVSPAAAQVLDERCQPASETLVFDAAETREYPASGVPVEAQFDGEARWFDLYCVIVENNEPKVRWSQSAACAEDFGAVRLTWRRNGRIRYKCISRIKQTDSEEGS